MIRKALPNDILSREYQAWGEPRGCLWDEHSSKVQCLTWDCSGSSWGECWERSLLVGIKLEERAVQNNMRRFPGSSVVKNQTPLMQEHGFRSWSGGIPRTSGAAKPVYHAVIEPVLDPGTTATGPMCCNSWSLPKGAPWACRYCNKRSYCNEKPTHHNKKSSRCWGLEKSGSNEELAQPKTNKAKRFFKNSINV